jgi:hypothetical protein
MATDPRTGRDPSVPRETTGATRADPDLDPPRHTHADLDDDRRGMRGRTPGTGPLRLLAILVIVGGVILSVAGAITWVVVTNQLSDEKITVADDADNFAGDKVDGPFTAYSQADIINEHALEDTDGQTYAQLDREDPRRETVMTASFLRASLFTSVVSFGVAAFAFGLGLLLIVIGLALLRVERTLRAVT